MAHRPKLPFNIVSLAEFDEDIDNRLYVDDLEENEWYLSRVTTELAKKFGGFAIETAVIIKAIRIRDDGHELEFTVLDLDGRPSHPGDTILHSDGMLRAPDEPNEEGYLMAYPGYPDDLLLRISEEAPVFSIH